MQLTPEQINDFIAKAVLESQIGDCVKQSVKRVVDELSKTYNNPFDAAIKNQVARLIEAEISTNYKAILQERVAAALATALTDEAMQSIIAAAVKKLTGRDY